MGWAYCLLLMVIPRVGCTRPDSDPYFAAMAVGALLVALSLGTRYGRALRATLRWLTLPLAFLVPFAAKAVLPYFGEAAVAGMHVCSASSGWAAAEGIAPWHRAWAPIQLGVLAALSVGALGYWRRDGSVGTL